MCTVTYVPRKEGFLFTSNRDELPSRNALDLVEKDDVIYPQDALRKGTWYLIRKGHFVRTLLNGAAEKHKHEPPYRRSRGLMMLDALDWETINTFAADYNFFGIEPFTIVDINFAGDELKVTQVRWDEKEIEVKEFDPEEPKIWSSSPLYPPDVRDLREKWFANHLNEKGNSPESLFEFHNSEFSVDPTINVLMKRSVGPCSISISHFNQAKNSLRHIDLVTGQEIIVDL